MERPNIVNREPEKKPVLGYVVGAIFIAIVIVAGLHFGGVIHLPI